MPDADSPTSSSSASGTARVPYSYLPAAHRVPDCVCAIILSDYLRQEPPDAETYCVRRSLTQILILYCKITDTLCSYEYEYLGTRSWYSYDALILIYLRRLLTQYVYASGVS